MLAEDGRAASARCSSASNLDPNDPEADLVLALDLADKHVPGFKLDRKVPRHGTKRKLKDGKIGRRLRFGDLLQLLLRCPPRAPPSVNLPTGYVT